jgi:uncharacterized protein YfaS (alpha-2-macroglobulin family)
MNARQLAGFLALALCGTTLALAQQQGRIKTFSPQGTAKNIRQVRVEFSEPMVSFGDPQGAPAPFDIRCAEKGTGRWTDPLNWVYDFEQDLPAGVRCEFTVRDGLKTLQKGVLAGQRSYQFSSGGPSIIRSTPFQGNESISEDQVFILVLDGEAIETSVLSHVSFSAAGMSERIGVRILSGPEKEAIIEIQYPKRFGRERPDHLLLIQAKQNFPSGSKVNLIWGRGVSSPSGVATEQDQVLAFRSQNPFTATFGCSRENAQADCIPVSAMRLSFSAKIPWGVARKIVMRGPAGKQWNPKSDEDQPPEDSEMVWGVTFKEPFPEASSFTVEIPTGIKDESGRKLANADRFPLHIRTAEYPPLAKFAADFGILELKADPVLPVTLRNIEPAVAAKVFQVEGGEGNFDPIPVESGNEGIDEKMDGKILKIPSDKASQMIAWIRKVSDRSYKDRDKSIFGSITAPKAKPFTIPKLQGSKPFEVVGIPLKTPGFYVVEIESEILGASLLGVSRPMYVSTTALVTNLSVHFKRGVESSLIWVTSLDKASPINQADLKVCDCEGRILWQGKTDTSGLARVKSLPKEANLPDCGNSSLGGLLVTAQLGDDMALVHTSWNDGIESWRFRLPTDWQPKFRTAHTILDRNLVRAGETLHMKHILRRQVTTGFALESAGREPKMLVIRHLGSDQEYRLPLKWDSAGVAESTWPIPQEARLGQYQIILMNPPDPNAQKGREHSDEEYEYQISGNFRVEEFRVPLMRAMIRPPSEPLVNPSTFPVDLTVSYLSGGGAGNLPIKFRYEVKPRYFSASSEYEGFVFSNGAVKEGLRRYEDEASEGPNLELKSTELVLDKTGSARTAVSGLSEADSPMEVLAELEFRDPNGEIQTASSGIPLWPAGRLIGIQPDSWMQSKGSLRFKVAVLDLHGKPIAGAPITVDAFQRKTYSHRKRLVGGFYAYEHFAETKRLGPLCAAQTDKRGMVICEAASPVSGQVILQASTKDENGRTSVANRELWVAGEDEWWFEAKDDDRIDVLPEKKHYEPGEKAKFQVRMPFRKATALITVEREGVGEAFLKEISGKEPVIEVPIRGNYAPNVFISVLVVRGRSSGVQPTAMVDLARPAYKLGISEISVGWKAHELKVKVSADRAQYRVRETAKVQISVSMSEGAPPPAGAEVALAAIDEGLLELMPNDSWQLLAAMMGRRSYNVQTSTAQMHVIGKRHFGIKALPQGGGGGNQLTRELFDTLLLWKGRVRLDKNGSAVVDVPLNDSITSFRIVAVATAGVDLFGTGSTSIQSTRDLIILSGIAPIVRQGDRFRSTFTLRNTTAGALEVRIAASVSGFGEPLVPQTISLGSGESKEFGWDLTAPTGTDNLKYLVEATAAGGISDRLSVIQKVVPAVPVRTIQATLTQLSGDYHLDVERPGTAIQGSGEIHVSLRPTLVDGMTGVTDYMNSYPYTCLEQNVSKAVALRDQKLWNKIAAALPTYLDSDGLLKYFPSSKLDGSDVLTSYVLSIAHEANYRIPADIQGRMVGALRLFIEGKVIRRSSLPTVDLSIRKLAAVEAISRSEQVEPALLSSITIEPNLWPTSAVIDWFNILQSVPSLQNRDARIREAEQILRTRLSYQGTTMNFSTETSDGLWWLMISPDENAVRLVLSVLNSPNWKGDIPQLIRGALARQQRGRWDTTVANAWGVLAVEKFSKAFEKTPVSGTSTASLEGRAQTVDWASSAGGKTLTFQWPQQKADLKLHMAGTGQPWATVRSLAAIPIKSPHSSGFSVKKTLTPIEQKERGIWSRGDLVRVRLDMDAQSDMTWVVVNDAIPAGTTILGTGLGRDSQLAVRGEKQEGWAWPAFEERSFEAFRAYYEFVPKGKWSIEYTVRLNNEGTMNLPPTRVEALYSPEMYGELPNEAIRIR